MEANNDHLFLSSETHMIMKIFEDEGFVLGESQLQRIFKEVYERLDLICKKEMKKRRSLKCENPFLTLSDDVTSDGCICPDGRSKRSSDMSVDIENATNEVLKEVLELKEEANMFQSKSRKRNCRFDPNPTFIKDVEMVPNSNSDVSVPDHQDIAPNSLQGALVPRSNRANPFTTPPFQRKPMVSGPFNTGHDIKRFPKPSNPFARASAAKKHRRTVSFLKPSALSSNSAWDYVPPSERILSKDCEEDKEEGHIKSLRCLKLMKSDEDNYKDLKENAGELDLEQPEGTQLHIIGTVDNWKSTIISKIVIEKDLSMLNTRNLKISNIVLSKNSTTWLLQSLNTVSFFELDNCEIDYCLSHFSNRLLFPQLAKSDGSIAYIKFNNLTFTEPQVPAGVMTIRGFQDLISCIVKKIVPYHTKAFEIDGIVLEKGKGSQVIQEYITSKIMESKGGKESNELNCKYSDSGRDVLLYEGINHSWRKFSCSCDE